MGKWLYVSLSVLLVFVVASSGCVNSGDLTQFVKQLPEIQEFLKDHPNAEISITLFSSDYIKNNTEKVPENCLPFIDKEKDYYNVHIKENDNEIAVFVSYDDKKVVCVQRNGTYNTTTNTTETPTGNGSYNFNWSNCTINDFINYEVTPYLVSSDAIDQMTGGKYHPKNSKFMSSSSDLSSPSNKVTGLVVEFGSEEEAKSYIGFFMSAVTTQPTAGTEIFMTLTGDEKIYKMVNRPVFVGGSSAGSHDAGAETSTTYLWQKDRFVFMIGGNDNDAMFGLVKWTVKKYTGSEPAYMDVKETLYDCWNGKCDKMENSKNCCTDCGCENGQQCLSSGSCSNT